MAHTYTNLLIHALFSTEVKAHIAQEEKHPRRRTYQEEVIALLKRHGVEFDSRFVV